LSCNPLSDKGKIIQGREGEFGRKIALSLLPRAPRRRSVVISDWRGAKSSGGPKKRKTQQHQLRGESLREGSFQPNLDAKQQKSLYEKPRGLLRKEIGDYDKPSRNSLLFGEGKDIGSRRKRGERQKNGQEHVPIDGRTDGRQRGKRPGKKLCFAC